MNGKVTMTIKSEMVESKLAKPTLLNRTVPHISHNRSAHKAKMLTIPKTNQKFY
jgi:hypothetical protein